MLEISKVEIYSLKKSKREKRKKLLLEIYFL